MGGRFSRQKGKRGEREVVQLLKAHGYEARRGQQFKGTPDSPDVVSESFHDFHIEVKRVEALSLYKAMSQAKEDASEIQRPIVFHKKNNEEWLVVMEAEELFKLLDDLMLDNI
jgi:Holliday junction resolvase